MSSVSNESLPVSPNLEKHRRSKSILKNKTDQIRQIVDPESERLLAGDNMSGSGVSDNGTVGVSLKIFRLFILKKKKNKFDSLQPDDFSPKRPLGMSSPMRPRLLTQRSTPSAIDSSRVTKFQQPRLAEELMIRQVKPSLQRYAGYVDHLTGDSTTSGSSEIRESSIGEAWI